MTWLLDRLSHHVARLTNVVVAIMATVMMAALILQVFSRYVLGASLVWSEELALMLFTWSTLLAATTALRAGAHVRLDLFLSLLPPRLRRAWQALIMLAILGFCLVLLRSGIDYTDATLGQVSAAMRVPIEVLHLAAPVCGALGCLHALALLFNPLAPAEAEKIG